MKAKAYSYIRFSSEQQKQGHSLQRQLEAAQKYAVKKGLTLDTNSFKDLAVSGFKGKNRADGKLKLFIDAVDSGKIKKGSYLIIESLDRLSREKVLKALGLLADILEKGIIVVTLMDEKEYTAKSINDTMGLMYSIMIMATAHEESSKKSDRVGKAWGKKRQDAIDYKTPMTKKMPTWMEIEDGKIVLIPEPAAIVKQIFEMYLGGKGKKAITRYLNENRVKNWNGGKIWHGSYVQKILSNKATFGVLENLEKKLYVEGYFPPVVSKAQFLKAQDIMKKNKLPIGRATNTLSNIFVGLCRCGSCGSSMHFVNKSSKNKPHTHEWKYLVCSMAKSGSKDCEYVGWQYPKLEKHILYSLREMDWSVLAGGSERDFDGEIFLKQDTFKQVKKDLKKLSDDYMNDTDLPKILIGKMKALEAQKDTLQVDIDGLIHEQILESERILKMDVQLVDEFYQSLTKDIDTRIKINQMIKSLVKKIVFKPVKDSGLWGVITIHFINGGIRIISILDKEQTTSFSVTNTGNITSTGMANPGFDTRIIIDGEAVFRDKVICNHYLDFITPGWVPRYENHQIHTIDGEQVVVYPDLKERFERDGEYTVVSDNKQDVGVIYSKKGAQLVVESIPDLPPAPEDARFDGNYDWENDEFGDV
ncbi:recombinase family protein [Desulfobacula sp.]|uniref:recombinase family protein n=1 Tax=Desulfobacula sp. TaxID=2593537 RepID=UPI00261D366F|nr:recombinase family protein [Desulfobacula sp.]